MLTARFKMMDLGKHFLGIDFDQSDNCVTMSQTKYVEKNPGEVQHTWL